jgi:hypothetical protein
MRGCYAIEVDYAKWMHERLRIVLGTGLMCRSLAAPKSTTWCYDPRRRSWSMLKSLPQRTAMTGFFTSQGWLLGKSLQELENRLGYGAGRLTTAGAAVYGFTRVPENSEFELAGYTNSSGGMRPDPSWVEADRAAAQYHANTGLPDSETVRKNAARASMSVIGDNRLVKVVPLSDGVSFPPGAGIPQWKLSELSAQRGTMHGELLFLINPGERYPRPNEVRVGRTTSG